MAEDEGDYVIEKVDAGASATIPMEAGQVKKGGFMMIKGKHARFFRFPFRRPESTATPSAIFLLLIFSPERSSRI